MKKMTFKSLPPPPGVSFENWMDWHWQMQHSLKTEEDFDQYFQLQDSERKAFRQGKNIFNIRVTPFYAQLCGKEPKSPLRGQVVPTHFEMEVRPHDELDPLGEKKHNPVSRVIHRYPDRVLFLVTDFCGVYCRYCTRKHFTGQDQFLIKSKEYEEALNYIKKNNGIKEVILSGGDPLTLSDQNLDRILFDLRKIEHLEVIRVGTRLIAAAPMRMSVELVKIFRNYKPVFVMSHINHPEEITEEAATALERCVDHGVPVMNQMVLLRGVNNHESLIRELSRRLVYLRVKPYYAFQCDPSRGTEHLRLSMQEFRDLQAELWGSLSGLAMPAFSVDIPNGGGKAGIVPDFEIERTKTHSTFLGWDGVRATYHSPGTALLLGRGEQ